ncbi:hypothetical protein BH18ACT10_BH18ACT10_07750 [soil metagenome]
MVKPIISTVPYIVKLLVTFGPMLIILVVVVTFAVAIIFASFKIVGSEYRWLRYTLRAVGIGFLLMCLLFLFTLVRVLTAPPA